MKDPLISLIVQAIKDGNADRILPHCKLSTDQWVSLCRRVVVPKYVIDQYAYPLTEIQHHLLYVGFAPTGETEANCWSMNIAHVNSVMYHRIEEANLG